MDGPTPRALEDDDEILELLTRDPIACAYMIGDLDEGYRDNCTWYGAGPKGALEGLLLLYEGLSAPVMITYGQSGAVEDTVNAFCGALPGRALVHLPPHHQTALERYYACDDLYPMLRMGMAAREFRGAPPSAFEVTRLSHRDTGDIVDLQGHYADNFFEPDQLGSGHYYGIRADGRLVSVAGVHVFSPAHKIACLGNIVTHTDFRGRGLSTACTSHLVAQLIREGIETLALNVRPQNRQAVRVYERLGFRYHGSYLEGWAVRTVGCLP